ncbi:uncharacterized protein LOC129600804 [Paramacrobiotus metropolitanus]|uniref:uncharacterized protein LOC129600804 n=1 Tax=Paramacrobiotus metropolitanus TaxID=2943436 RepID=UPI002445C5AA|nr:uncharacterized protein LOC129600804 [Paramacrobiotus metropolitanus]
MQIEKKLDSDLKELDTVLRGQNDPVAAQVLDILNNTALDALVNHSAALVIDRSLPGLTAVYFSAADGISRESGKDSLRELNTSYRRQEIRFLFWPPEENENDCGLKITGKATNKSRSEKKPRKSTSKKALKRKDFSRPSDALSRGPATQTSEPAAGNGDSNGPASTSVSASDPGDDEDWELPDESAVSSSSSVAPCKTRAARKRKSARRRPFNVRKTPASLQAHANSAAGFGQSQAGPSGAMAPQDDTVVEVMKENVVGENVVDENVVDENVVDENVVDENVVDENVVDENVVDENVVDENVVDENVVDENVVDENVVDENVVDENVVDENVVDDNGVDDNGVDDNGVDDNGVDDNGVDDNGVDENGVDENVVDENVVDENVVDENVVDENVVDENVAGENVVLQPDEILPVSPDPQSWDLNSFKEELGRM